MYIGINSLTQQQQYYMHSPIVEVERALCDMFSRAWCCIPMQKYVASRMDGVSTGGKTWEIAMTDFCVQEHKIRALFCPQEFK